MMQTRSMLSPDGATSQGPRGATRPRRAGLAWLRTALSATVVVLMLATSVAAPAGADTLDELEARQKAAEKKKANTEAAIDALAEDLEDTDAQMAEAYIRLKKIEGQLPVAQAALDSAEASLDKSEREAKDLAGRLADAKTDETNLVTKLKSETDAKEETRSSIAELARRAYRGEGNPDGVSLIIGAQSAQDFVNQYSLSQTAIRTQSNSLGDLQQSEAISLNTAVRLDAVRTAITGLKADADAAVKVAADATVAAAEHRASVAQLITDQQSAAALIEDRRTTQMVAKGAKEQAANDLTDELQDIIGLTKAEKSRIKAAQDAAAKKAADDLRREQAEARRKKEAERKAAEEAANKKPTATPGTSSPAAPPEAPAPPRPPSRPNTPSTPKPPNTPKPSGGVLAYPTRNVHITSSYGYRLHPVLGYVRLHAGTDFRAYCGTGIYASASGTVVGARMRAGFGNQVIVNHGTVNGANLMTSYNHLSRFAVSNGERVKKGELVGYSGNTGLGTACHLHFEVYVNGSTVNPMSML